MVNYEALRVKPVGVVVNRLAADVTRGFAPGDDPPVPIPPGSAPANPPTVGCGHVTPWPTGWRRTPGVRGDDSRAVSCPHPRVAVTPRGLLVGCPRIRRWPHLGQWGHLYHPCHPKGRRINDGAPACTLTGASTGNYTNLECDTTTPATLDASHHAPGPVCSCFGDGSEDGFRRL